MPRRSSVLMAAVRVLAIYGVVLARLCAHHGMPAILMPPVVLSFWVAIILVTMLVSVPVSMRPVPA